MPHGELTARVAGTFSSFPRSAWNARQERKKLWREVDEAVGDAWEDGE